MNDDAIYFGEGYWPISYWPTGYWGAPAVRPVRPRPKRCPHKPVYQNYRTAPGKLECIDKNYWIEGKKLHWRIRRYK